MVVEFELQLFLSVFHQEITDSLRNRVSDIPHNNSEVSINSHSDLLYKHIGTFLGLVVLLENSCLSCSSIVRVLAWLSRLSWLCWVVWIVAIILRHNICSVLQVVDVIGEQVVLLSIDDCLYQISSFVSLSNQTVCDYFHDFWYD